MAMDRHELTREILKEMGIKDPDPALAEEFETHFARVIMETLLRRVPEERLQEVKEKIEQNDADLEELVADIAAEIPGLSVEIEEAIAREHEVIRNMLLSRTK